MVTTRSMYFVLLLASAVCYGAHHGHDARRGCCGAPPRLVRSQRFQLLLLRSPEFPLRSARSLECKTSLACTRQQRLQHGRGTCYHRGRTRLPSTPAALARSATSSPTRFAFTVLSRSSCTQLCFHGGSGCQGYALDIVDNLNEHVTGRTGDAQARTRSGTRNVLRMRA